MNNKVLIGIIVVLLILIGAVRAEQSSDGELARDNGEEEVTEETALVNENGVVASANNSSMFGVWKNEKDPSYVLEFAADGVLREYYARELTGVGTWRANNGVLTTSVNGSSRSYDVIELSASSFSAKYQTSDVVVNFDKVEI